MGRSKSPAPVLVQNFQRLVLRSLRGADLKAKQVMLTAKRRLGRNSIWPPSCLGGAAVEGEMACCACY